MKKRTLIAVVFGIICLLLVFGLIRIRDVGVEEVRIGVLIPLTGKFASFGEDIKNGLSLAVEDLKDEKPVIDFVFEDSAADPKIALSASKKLIDLDKVPVIIGGPGSSANLAVAPSMESSGTLFLVISSTPKLNEAGQHVFKVHHDIEFEVDRIAPLITEKGYKRIGIIFDSASDTQVTGKDYFTKRLVDLGGSVVASEGYDGKTVSDLRTQLTNIKKKNPDALYFLAVEKIAGVAVKQARELGLNQPIFSWAAANGGEFFAGAANAADGVIISDLPFSCEGTEKMKNYCEKYQTKFSDRRPQNYGAHAYDLVTIINDILKKEAGKPADEIKKSIQEAFTSKIYEGVSGDLRFDENGNVRDKDFVFRIAENGKFVDLQK